MKRTHPNAVPQLVRQWRILTELVDYPRTVSDLAKIVGEPRKCVERDLRVLKEVFPLVAEVGAYQGDPWKWRVDVNATVTRFGGGAEDEPVPESVERLKTKTERLAAIRALMPRGRVGATSSARRGSTPA